MKKFTIEGLKREVRQGLEKMDKEQLGFEPFGPAWKVIEFSSEAFGIFGGVIVSTGSATQAIIESLPKDITSLVRKYGVTDSIFLLTVGQYRMEEDDFFYDGWIYWNSVKIVIDNKFTVSTHMDAYSEGIKTLFKVVDDTRFILKLSQMVRGRFQSLGVQFKP